MSFSAFLHSRRADAKALVAELKKKYDYVSVLGVDVKSRSISVSSKLTNISSGMDTECGFVVKAAGDGVFYEYSLDDIHGNLQELVEEIEGTVIDGIFLFEAVMPEGDLEVSITCTPGTEAASAQVRVPVSLN